MSRRARKPSKGQRRSPGGPRKGRRPGWSGPDSGSPTGDQSQSQPEARRGGAVESRPEPTSAAVRPELPPASEQSPRTNPEASAFAQLIRGYLTPAERSGSPPVEPLAHLAYDRELDIKNRALAAFWEQHDLTGTPAAIEPSPRPRHYRTTTRRRAQYLRGQLQLGFGGVRDAPQAVPPSALEPVAHTSLYQFLAGELSLTPNRPIASHLNHAIIRGSYEAHTVILNLDELSGPIVRRLKVLSQKLQERPEPVRSAFAFCDPSQSDYYLEREAPAVPVRLKKLFGPARLPLRLAGRRYDLAPTSFSQVNESMVEPMLAVVRRLMQPREGDRLLDLYCGYGLFASDFSDTCAEVIGLDVDRDSIRSGRDHLQHNPPAGQVSLSCRDITAESLERALPHAAPSAPGGRELVILDPPRQGAPPEVLHQLARRRPAAVAHIFCAIEGIPAALAEWRRGGYEVDDCVPLDMFPGTPNLETIVALRPSGG